MSEEADDRRGGAASPSSGGLDGEGWQAVRDAMVDAIEADGWTDVAGGALLAMFECCEDGHAHDLKALLAEHADLDVNVPGPDGDRALNLACLYGHLECVRLLLARGVDAGLVNEDDGSTALHDAAAGGYLEICEAVLEMMPGLVHKGAWAGAGWICRWCSFMQAAAAQERTLQPANVGPKRTRARRCN